MQGKQVEQYDGSSWTAGGALNQKRWNSSAGAGTQTAALASTGYNDGNVTNSEEYNGSSWTAGNAIDEGKRGQGQCEESDGGGSKYRQNIQVVLKKKNITQDIEPIPEV